MTEHEADEIERISQKLDRALDGERIDLAFVSVVHRVAQLGMLFETPKEDLLNVARLGISEAYDEYMESMKEDGKNVSK